MGGEGSLDSLRTVQHLEGVQSFLAVKSTNSGEFSHIEIRPTAK
jgi:hypothetical protein